MTTNKELSLFKPNMAVSASGTCYESKTRLVRLARAIGKGRQLRREAALLCRCPLPANGGTAILFGRYSVVCLRITAAENSQSTQLSVALCPPHLFEGERPLPWQNTFYAIIILNKFALLVEHTGKPVCVVAGAIKRR